MGTVKLKKKSGISLGELIDRLYQKRAERLVLSKQADDMKKDEDAIRTTIISMLDSQDLTGSKGNIAQASIKTSIIPAIDDFDDFFKYVVKHKAPDLLWRKVNAVAVRERWDAGKAVDGITQFTVRDLNLTKK